MTLLVREFQGCFASKFRFNGIEALEQEDVDIIGDDIFHNYTNKGMQRMNSNVLWIGPQEHEPNFIKMLIEVALQFGDMVLDYIATTSELLQID